MTQEEAKKLIEKYVAGNCTDAEKAMLHAWYLKTAAKDTDLPEENEIEQALKEIGLTLPVQAENLPGIRKRRIWQVAAAVTLLCLSCAAYFFWLQQPVSRTGGNVYKNDVEPGGDKAVLILADGSKIDLSSAAVGELSTSSAASIVKTRDNRVVCREPELPDRNEDVPAFNTIGTPRGGQYRVVLPDGSRVWLNAASSIRFPAVFSRSERQVEITGEVYFEVAGKTMRTDTGLVKVPFVVRAGDQLVEVLGTHFNINAYSTEEGIKTSLLEGSVRVSLPGRGGAALLTPGEEARVSVERDRPIIVARTSSEEAVAWKNGLFKYNQTGIETIMRQVERWYDVEVVYEGRVPDKKFIGTIPRDLPLSKFLDIVSYTGVNFRIEGRKITVIP